jgi:hypothetical protein
MIFQLLEFFDIFHELILNLFPNIQTWILITTKLLLKYRSFVQKKSRERFSMMVFVCNGYLNLQF